MAGADLSRLAEFLEGHRERILEEWMRQERAGLAPAQARSRHALTAPLPRFLDSLIEAARCSNQPERVYQKAVADHAGGCLEEGIGLEEVAGEYRWLRGCLSRLVREEPGRLPPEELEFLHEALDEAILHCITVYTHSSEATLRRSEVAERHHAERLSRFHTVATSLAGATTEAQVVELVVTEGVAVLGAQSGVLCLLSEDGQWLEIRQAVGYLQELIEPWQRISMETPVMLRDAVRTRQLLVHETLESFLQQYPHLDKVSEATGHHALVAVPLMAEGEVLGVLGLSFPQARSFSAEDRSFMAALAAQCARALERARLYKAERSARAQLEEEVAEHKQAEAALRFSEARFRSLVQATSQLVWSTDAAGVVVEDSPSWRAFTGQPLEAWLGSGWVDSLHPEDRAQAVQTWREAVATQSAYEVEYRVRRSDGHYTPMLARGAPVLNPDGTVREWMAANTDITERKAAEGVLRFHIEVGQVLSASLDTETTLRNVARLAVSRLADFCTLDLLDEHCALQRLEAYATDPVTNAITQRLRQYPPRVEGNTPMAQVLRTVEPRLEYITSEWLDRVAQTPDHRAILEELKPTAAVIMPLKARGRTLGLLNLCWTRSEPLPTPRDLQLAQTAADWAAVALDNARLYAEAQAARTQAEQSAARFRLAEQELQRTGIFRDQFIGILGHDLRGPLSAVRMSAELLLRKHDLSEAQLRSVQRISSSTDKMMRMISNILDFARGRLGGGIPLELERADLQEIARQAVEELAVAHPEQVLEFHAEGDGRGQFDPDRLSQVVGNLVSNALSHGRPGTPVRITVRDGGPEVVLEVWNQGTPIAPEFLPRIFEPFRQGEARLSSHGLGLGLYIVAEVVKAHGGTVEARSTAEEGTTFTVRLPRTRAR